MSTSASHLFNSPMELGLRALCLLVELYPQPQDLQRLVLLDYLLVHSADVDGGPPSIHAATPQRGAEVLVRRAILEPGLALFARRGLIVPSIDAAGFAYLASDRGACFLDTLRSPYLLAIRDRGRWISERFGSLPTATIQGFVNDKLDRWGGQFTDTAAEGTS